MTLSTEKLLITTGEEGEGAEERLELRAGLGFLWMRKFKIRSLMGKVPEENERLRGSYETGGQEQGKVTGVLVVWRRPERHLRLLDEKNEVAAEINVNEEKG